MHPDAKHFLKVVAFVYLVIAFLVVSVVPSPGTFHNQFDSVLKVIVPGGHGSGVHIGNGYVVTAGHVVKDQKFAGMWVNDVKLKRATAGAGDQKTVPGMVLWSNEDFDVSLVKAPDLVGTPSAKLVCVDPEVGTPIQAIGSPLDLEYIRMFGWIAGSKRIVDGKWEEGMLTNLQSMPGMSGGPVFRQGTNQVAGILVGSYGTTSLSITVPSSTICMLMGRVE